MLFETKGAGMMVGLLLATSLLSGCTGGTPANTNTTTTVSTSPAPRSAKVERRDVIASATLQGKVTAPPTKYAEISSPFRAPVEKVYVTLGATVKEGDILVELSSN